MEYFEETVLGEILNMAMDNCCLQIAAKAKSSSASKSSVSILPEAATEQNEGRPNSPFNLYFSIPRYFKLQQPGGI